MPTIETKHLPKVIADHSQNMTGKVVVITGTTSGTGYICALEVTKKGAKVVLLNRKSERAEKALKELQSEVPDGHFESIECDLQSFASVEDAIAWIKSKYEVIDVLVNNAGVMALEDKRYRRWLRRADANQRALAFFADQRALSVNREK